MASWEWSWVAMARSADEGLGVGEEGLSLRKLTGLSGAPEAR